MNIDWYGKIKRGSADTPELFTVFDLSSETMANHHHLHSSISIICWLFHCA